MKIAARQVESFLRKPPPEIRVVLVYGPDRGLVRERLKTLGLSVVSDFNDPFNVTVLNGDDLAAAPARLADEANAFSMMGGRRLIRIESASEKIVPALKDYLAAPNPEALVIIEAEELTPRSSLRKLCESAESTAALACYVEDERDLLSTIRTIVTGQGCRISSDALQWLAANLQGDRQRVRSEVDKLLIYMGGEKEINLDHACNCCGEAGIQSLDMLVFSAGEGNSEAALQSFARLKAEGVPEIVALRALQNHYRRLHQARARIDEGESPDIAVNSLQPPVFFKYEQSFKSQLSRLSLKKIEHVLDKLCTIEAQCKQTRMPAETLCSQAILGISRL